MQNKIIAKKLLNEFLKLKLILIKERENNWIRGVLAIIEKLELALSNHCNESVDYCKDACDTWKAMYKGNGSFSDYYIWHDDFEQRVKLNKPLDSIKENIWKIIKDNGL
ncbi:hypothetical protein [Pantoea vagans]|uniref:hypothetical protein n=1 Tax=Pantoea vagans TaxID=470934 RepID=UPI003B02C6D9